MGNPYYIQPQKSGVMEGVDTLSRLYGLYQAHKGLGLKEKELGMRERVSQQEATDRAARLDLDREKLGVSREANRLAGVQVDQKEREMPAHRQNFDLGRVTMLRAAMASQGVDKAFAPALDTLEKLAEDANVTRGDAYRYLKQPNVLRGVQKSALEGLSKDYQKAVESGDMMRAEQLSQLIQGVGNTEGLSKMIDTAFGPTVRGIAAEEAEIAETQAGAAGEQFGPRTTDQYGNVLQQNLTTGEWEKVSSPNRSTVIRQTPDGGLEVIQGAAGSDMQRGTRKNLEERAINAQEGIARLNEIAQSYQPEFQQIGTRVKTAWTSLKDKLQGTPVEEWVGKASPEDQEQLAAFSEFKRDSLSNINLYIKEITGAQMSEREADRIRKAMPDPGEGLFDGDSPAQFEAKWNRTMRSLKLANARYVYYLKTAPEKLQSGEIMSLDRFKNRIADREEELREAGLADQEIATKLNEEFFSLGQ